MRQEFEMEMCIVGVQEEVKPEKLSYAQMAGQKPKPTPVPKPVTANGNGGGLKTPQSPQQQTAGSGSSGPSSPTAAGPATTPINPTQHSTATIAIVDESACLEASPSSAVTQETPSP